ncbi:MAG: hypothetical protein NTW10_07865 [Bacteroidetes bacterium]|nr:hypothetical protein [Bacteroidota bacterium]
MDNILPFDLKPIKRTNNLEYDPVTDKWAEKADMPDFSSGGVYYGTGNRGYFGLGYMTSPYYWEFNPD